jgi:type II secretory pathway predicted ATPase ExeA
MYENFFELSQRPFVPNPLTSRYFAGSAIENARSTLARCIERAEGAGLVVGASGTGKTLLCYLLAEQFRNSLAVAMLFSGHLASRQDLLRAILFELGQPYRGMDEGELRLSLIDYLSRSEECSQGLLLLIDEAHALPLRLLEEIRTITNLVRGGQPQVRLVLAGGPALEEHFASPKLESFAQRLAARCYLEPFDRGETFNYVRSQLTCAGAEPANLFSDSAIEAVYRATDGIPRLINQVCDHALVLAQQHQVRRLEAAEVETAWADLQQLPAPWTEPAMPSSAPTAVNVVEFGDLDDEFFAPGPELRLALPPSELQDDEFHPDAAEANLAEFGSISVTEDHLDHLHEQWEQLEADFLSGNQEGLPEVDLIFDEALASEEPEQQDPLVAISYTNASCQQECGNRCQASLEADEPVAIELPEPVRSHEAEPIFSDNVATAAEGPAICDGVARQGESVAENRMQDEELIVDRYAALDSLKHKGVYQRQVAAPPSAMPRKPVSTPYNLTYQTSEQSPPVGLPVSRVAAARPNLAAEKNLTLAEALVRHATAVEQTTIGPPASPESMFSVLSMPASAESAPTDAWTPLSRESIDTVAASSEYAAQLANASAEGGNHPDPAVAPAARSEPAHVVALDGSAWGMESSAQQQRWSEAANHDELDLIVVEDDPQSVVVPTPPRATPVRRQEYRQLFARLRKS